jgi:hypothetical protein
MLPLTPAPTLQPTLPPTGSPQPGGTPTVASGVTVKTDKTRYQSGEGIVVTVYNGLTTEIEAPPPPGHCSLVDVQRLEASGWVALEPSCPTGTLSPISIAPQGEVSGTVGAPPGQTGTPPIVVGTPVAPGEFGGNLGTLPTAIPWQTGTPVHEGSRGVLPTGTPALPFSLWSTNLQPGTYRIAFTFVMNSSPTQSYTVTSEEFAVTG